MDSEDDLLVAATRLKSAAPIQFNEFMAALNTYYFTVTSACADANDHVQIEQGRARQCKKFLDLFSRIGVRHG